jgi:hypothetical protein
MNSTQSDNGGQSYLRRLSAGEGAVADDDDANLPVQEKEDANSKMAFTRQKDELERARLEDLKAIREQYPKSLLLRMKKCRANNRIDIADRLRDKETGEFVPKLTELNLLRIYDALFIGKTIADVHCDTSRRMIVDESGRQIDDVWSPRELMEAIQVVGLRSQNGSLSAAMVKRTLRTWALANQFNDISERVRTKLEEVEWDGASRLEAYLIKTLGLEDSADNRLFSKYWCLSLYNRVMHPGCLAPISMAMFGSMDAGKSHFQNMICRELLFNKKAAPVTFDPNMDKKQLFRDIYGISIIATIPEMTGFGTGDLRKMKAILTGTTDTFDQKFGFSDAWPRQFIFVMDGNRYAGLFRDNDDTNADGRSQGERRWFPVFVGQIPGASGEVRWDQKFKVDFSEQFGLELWQVMKECDSWMASHDMDGYEKLVMETTAMVKEFSRREKEAGQGTVKDEMLDELFPRVMYRAVQSAGWIGSLAADGGKVRGLCVFSGDVIAAYKMLEGRPISPQKLNKKIALMKDSHRGRFSATNVTAFVFEGEEFSAMEDGRAEGGKELAEAFWRKYVSEVVPDSDYGQTDGEKSRDGF